MEGEGGAGAGGVPLGLRRARPAGLRHAAGGLKAAVSAALLQRAVRGFAVYDLCVTLPFATQWTAEALASAPR
ncbi:hypothetical protein D7X96_36630 [Corallococcus interemptor]|uniref:Uncharacterized protein n=1 Tax=Corallococcus interemptor TaxID=2316720 RepID=A0A3A8Q5Q1_9BACT|nr:hypothetical protein D7X96_36630 [Corallococcus interemptor]